MNPDHKKMENARPVAASNFQILVVFFVKFWWLQSSHTELNDLFHAGRPRRLRERVRHSTPRLCSCAAVLLRAGSANQGATS